MSIPEIVLAVILFVGAALLALFGIRHLQYRGYCFNNAYIYASKREREQMDKTPYYKQTGIILLMLAGLFLINFVRVVFKLEFLMYVSYVVIALTLVYAVVSSVRLEKNK